MQTLQPLYACVWVLNWGTQYSLYLGPINSTTWRRCRS